MSEIIVMKPATRTTLSLSVPSAYDHVTVAEIVSVVLLEQ